MKTNDEIRRSKKITAVQEGWDGGQGYILFPNYRKPMVVVWSNGMGWDHVSCSFNNRTPRWEEMAAVKDIFFGEDETVVQFHPPKADYINNHPHCLHLWRPQDEEIPRPPSILVGVK